MPERQTSSGPFGRGGNQIVSVEMVFHGAFNDAFEQYVRERAARLGLVIEVDGSPKRFRIRARGPETMVGALEMSACIGTAGSRIDDWTTVLLNA